MPDTWETAHGLNPNSASDGNGDYTGDGYTNVEKYLNSLADDACPSGVPTTPPETADAGTSDAAPALSDANVTPGKDAGVPTNPDVGTARPDAAVLGGDARPDAIGPGGDTAVVRSDVAIPTSDAAAVLADAISYPVGDTAPPTPDVRVSAAADAPTGPPPAGTDAAGSNSRPRTTAGTASKGCSCSVGGGRSSNRLAFFWIVLGLLFIARKRPIHFRKR